ncbi:MAG: hypothetical protein SPL12_05720 [Bacteroidales bacterium]|nr:hypothetical protein [Bacteroidales bacterium]
MCTETANLIVACASLVVMVATLAFMVKNSKGYLRRKLREKERRYNSLDNLCKISPFSPMAGLVNDRHFEERDKLEQKIEDIKEKL